MIITKDTHWNNRHSGMIANVIVPLVFIVCASLLAACSHGIVTPSPAGTPLQEDASARETAEATESGSETPRDNDRAVALYLGVLNYGAPETNKQNRDSFTYRFEINGEERTYALSNGEPDKDGNYRYPIQNVLKEGYQYERTVEDGTVISAKEIKDDIENGFEPVLSARPGEKTLKNFILTALEPVGTTLYIYGGGWDWQDEGSSVQATTLGVSADWVRFFNSQDADYTYKERDGDKNKADPATSYYPYGEYNEYYYAGLDCSGYLGWVIYNTFETENGREGYVGASTKFAKKLSGKGWGEWSQRITYPGGIPEQDQTDSTLKPGDVISIRGHVWISLGTCADGSILIVHSTPSKSRTGQPGGGVQISALGNDKNCEAYVLADRIMSSYYSEWYERYPVCLADPGVYMMFDGDQAGVFSWYTDGSSGMITDPDHLSEMTPQRLIETLFGAFT